MIWVYLRHYINLIILYATLTTFRTVGPFQLDWAAEQYKCWFAQWITFGLLAILQCINLFWLFFIVKIALNVVFANVVQDVRSDDEDDEEVEGDVKKLGVVNDDINKIDGALGSVNSLGEGKKEL